MGDKGEVNLGLFVLGSWKAGPLKDPPTTAYLQSSAHLFCRADLVRLRLRISASWRQAEPEVIDVDSSFHQARVVHLLFILAPFFGPLMLLLLLQDALLHKENFLCLALDTFLVELFKGLKIE